MPTVLPYGLSIEEHFMMAHQLAHYPTPFEVAPALDADLRFAAKMTAQGRAGCVSRGGH